MGTCKEESEEQPEAIQGPIVEDNFITGPPASRTVIDNLKKLLVKRQHSRESDYENKQKSTSGSNSDAAFFSQFSTSSSDSESDSDACLIFEDISNQDNRKSSGGRRRHRRQRSYSSSSSSTRSPAEKRRRKPTKSKRAASTEDQGLPATGGGDLTSTRTASREDDSANSTSSHKDSSSSDEENVGISVQPSTDDKNPVTNQTRLPKFKSRRDRNRKRRRSETNYANDRPINKIPTIVISHIEDDKKESTSIKPSPEDVDPGTASSPQEKPTPDAAI